MAEGGMDENVYTKMTDEEEETSEESRERTAVRVREEIQRISQRTFEEQRQLYACREQWLGLDDLPTWNQHAAGTLTARPSSRQPPQGIDWALNEKLSLFCGDITRLEVDAIVNAAKQSLLGGGGVDGAIHAAAGPFLKLECSLLGGCDVGEAKISSGYNLPAKNVIHTVGPQGEQPQQLHRTYESCIEVLMENNIRSIAFPCISTGIYGYDIKKATPIALSIIRNFLEGPGRDMDRVILCVFSEGDRAVYEEAMHEFFPTDSDFRQRPEPEQEDIPLTLKTEEEEVAPTPSPRDQEVTFNLPPIPSSPTPPTLELVVGHADRQLRQPAIIPAREADERDRLVEFYRKKSEQSRDQLKIFVRALEETPPNKKFLKSKRIAMSDLVTELNEIREGLTDLVDCTDIDADLSDLTHQAEIAKEDYYRHFKRAYSQAPSSVFSSTVLSIGSDTPQRALLVAEAANLRLEDAKEAARLEEETKRSLTALEAEKKARAEKREREITKAQEAERKAKADNEEQVRKAQEAERKAKADNEEQVRKAQEAERKAKADNEEQVRKAQEAERKAKADQEEQDRKAQEAERKATALREETDMVHKKREEEIRASLKAKREIGRLEREAKFANMAAEIHTQGMPNLPKVNRMDDFLDDVAASKDGDRKPNFSETRQDHLESRQVTTHVNRGRQLQATREPPRDARQSFTFRQQKEQSGHHIVNLQQRGHPVGLPPQRVEKPEPYVEEDWRAEGTRLLYPNYRGTSRPCAVTTTVTTTTQTATTMTPLVQASYLSKQGGPRPPPVSSAPTPRFHYAPLRTTYYPPAPQFQLDPTAEPFPGYAESESVHPQTRDLEDAESLGGSAVGTQTEGAELTRAPEENSENSTLTKGILHMSKSIADAVSLGRLPIQEPPVFYGDAMMYPTWRSTFTLLIERQGISPEEKMIYLQRFLGGRARETVQGLFLMSGAESYYKALAMLQERYGGPISIAGAFREKFDEWPTVKTRDGEGLRRLADFLQQCLIASQVVGQLAILDDPQYQRTLTEKLPEWMQRGWLDRVSKTKKRTSQYPVFKELVEYITEKADTACEPVFTLNVKPTTATGSKTSHLPATRKPNVYFVAGKSGPPHNPENNRPPREGVTTSSDRENFKRPCGFCGEPRHNILFCRHFMSLDPTRRITYLFENKLCFSCAVTDTHQSRDCGTKPRCRDCDKSHLTILHGAPRLDFGKLRPENSGPHNQGGSTGRGGPPFQAENNSSAPRPGRPLHFGAPQSGGSNSTGRLLPPSTPSQGNGQDRQGQSPQKRDSPETEVKGNNALLISTYRAEQGVNVPTSMMVPVLVSSRDNPQHEIKTYALLDTQSCVTFVSNTIVRDLDVTPREVALRLNTMTSQAQSVKCGKVSGLQIRRIDSQRRHLLPDTYTTDNLNLNPDNVPTRETAEKYPHLRGMAPLMPEYDQSCGAGLLIGFDCPDLLMPLEVVMGHPFAVRTALGWSIVGKAAPTESVRNVHFASCVSETRQTEPPDEKVINVYRTSVAEVPPVEILRLIERDFVETETGTKSQEDVRFMDIIGGNIARNEEGHYEMPLPFKRGSPHMPDNRDAARQRVLGLLRRFEKDEAHKARYQAFMGGIIESGHAERVPDEEIHATNRWYIPHHGVYGEKKPDKIRVVFDCSVRHQGACINDELLQGPDLINSLIGVLCRFRQGKIAFSCDVEKMFHQFHVVREHRDYLRFLWWEDGDTTKSLRDYRMRVHIFGAVSSPGCANFGLQQVGRDHEHVDHEAAQFLQHDFYVDDGLHASDDVETAANILTQAIKICEDSKLHLHKIVSNSPELLNHFPEADRSSNTTQKIGREDETATVERILGLQWEISDDAFTFTSEIKPKPETRRGILSTVASVYDPLGLISPLILQGKFVLQQACGEKLDWDASLTEDLKSKWRSWMTELEQLREIRIPRSFYPSNFDATRLIELHHFSDASETGYGQCSYLRVLDVRDRVHCSLVMSKSRVAPLKTVTIPRLELQGAALSVKIAKYLDTELRIANLSHHFWTDSQLVLKYLANESRRFHVFIANRVSQILEFSNVNQWRHVASENNPADHASRGKGVGELNLSSWFSGPKFLWDIEIPMEEQQIDVDESEMEIRANRATDVREDFAHRFSRFSTKSSLVRGVACLLRCQRRLLKKQPLSMLETIQLAESHILRHAQAEFFEPPTPAMKKTFESLDAKQDPAGSWRIGGRLRNVRDQRLSHPLILPRDSHVSELWVKHTHERMGHAGRTSVIQELRSQGFHVMGVRHVVRRVFKECLPCIKSYAGPEGQRMADLPTDRITPTPPFTCCGIDCFGPFVVQEGRKQMKRYGLIVTCLAMRAIHLEVLDDMSTDAFLNGLRNVIALRGNIRMLRSDRGTNFIGAKRELKEGWKAMDQDMIRRRLANQEIEWILNPPSASHMGGVWERPIRTVRSVLTGLTKKSDGRLNTSSLRTLFYEVMAIVNSRPLSVESLEDPLGPVPLTPNHILTSKSSGILPPPGVFEGADLVAKKSWRRVQFLADEFWRRWRNDFLATLQTRRKWHRRQQNLAKGDIVILREEGVSRSYWKLAKVEEILPGDDGLVRKCKISVAEPSPKYGGRGGSIDRTTYERPVHKLTLLVRV